MIPSWPPGRQEQAKGTLLAFRCTRPPPSLRVVLVLFLVSEQVWFLSLNKQEETETWSAHPEALGQAVGLAGRCPRQDSQWWDWLKFPLLHCRARPEGPGASQALRPSDWDAPLSGRGLALGLGQPCWPGLPNPQARLGDSSGSQTQWLARVCPWPVPITSARRASRWWSWRVFPPPATLLSLRPRRGL